LICRRWLGVLAALAATGTLAACGSPAAIDPPRAAVAPAATPLPRDEAVAVVLPPRQAPPRRFAVGDLAGRNDGEVTRLFGQPRLVRREAPAEVWQFPGPACTLLVYFYPADGALLRVQHADAVPRRAGGKISGEDCVESLLRAPPPALS
jgi:hypothetical protein